MVEVNATVSREQLYRAAIDPDQEATVIHGTASEIVLDIEDDVEDLVDTILESPDSELADLESDFGERVLDEHIERLKAEMPEEIQ